MPRRKSGFRKDDPFVSLSEMINKPKKKAPPAPVRKVSMSPQAKIRARSVGVSSSSRQRTHKRGPANRGY